MGMQRDYKNSEIDNTVRQWMTVQYIVERGNIMNGENYKLKTTTKKLYNFFRSGKVRNAKTENTKSTTTITTIVRYKPNAAAEIKMF